MDTYHTDAWGSAINAVGQDQYNVTNFSTSGEPSGLLCNLENKFHMDAMNRFFECKPEFGEAAPQMDASIRSECLPGTWCYIIWDIDDWAMNIIGK